MAVYIQNIATALPDFRYNIEEITRFLVDTASSTEAARKSKIVAQKSGIKSRYAVIDDFHKPSNPVLFQAAQPPVEDRMKVYHKEALPLAIKAIEKLNINPASITHIITISCTGMTAPGLELQLTKALSLSNTITKHAVNFVGCHGSFHALKMAAAYAKQNPEANILIVSVELCSLHYQPSNDDDTILANVLFGDGAAACIVSGQTPKSRALQLNDFRQTLLPDDGNLMAWDIHSKGFLLRLSSYVPKAIKQGMDHILGPNEKMPEHWAVHPGGKKILQTITDTLHLSEDALEISHEVLEDVGNLSSASILFVLERILKSDRTGSVLGLGFGPGLSIEKMYGNLIDV